MPVPWIQVYSNLTSHPKTYALADALKLPGGLVSPNNIAAGMLVGLWTWAIINAVDGDISQCSPRALSEAAGWRKKPEIFLQALKDTRWVDQSEQILVLHDWEEYAGLMMDRESTRKQGTRKRVQQYRERKKECNGENPQEQADSDHVTVTGTGVTISADSNATVTQCNALRNGYGNGVVTQCNAPTIPCTLPNPMNTHTGDARVREAIEFYEQISGKLVPGAMQEEIKMRLSRESDMELVKEALRLSVGKQKPAPYFAKLLQNWTGDGIKNYQDYCAKNRTEQTHGPPKQKKTFAQLAAEMGDGS